MSFEAKQATCSSEHLIVNARGQTRSVEQSRGRRPSQMSSPQESAIWRSYYFLWRRCRHSATCSRRRTDSAGSSIQEGSRYGSISLDNEDGVAVSGQA